MDENKEPGIIKIILIGIAMFTLVCIIALVAHVVILPLLGVIFLVIVAKQNE